MRLSPVSIHESSHATIGERLGLPVVSITAVPNLSLGYAGLVCFADLHRARSSGPAEFRERLRVSALVSLSGAAAEAEFTREPISGILRRCDGDRLDAHRCASTYALSSGSTLTPGCSPASRRISPSRAPLPPPAAGGGIRHP